MKHFIFASLCVVLMAATLQAQPPKGPKTGRRMGMDRAMTPMFGEKLENGDFKEGDWIVGDDGVISSPGSSELWTKQKYGSFVCKFEFKTEKGANAGFIVHASEKGDWVPNAIEIQLLEDFGDEPNYHTCGSIYGYQAPKENASKAPGEWNEMRVMAFGRTLTVFLNGKMINWIDTGKWTDPLKSPEGNDIEEKFQSKSLASQEPYGYLGFQGKHSDSLIYYRNFEIAPITEPFARDNEEWVPLFGENLENAEFNPEVWSVDADGVLHATKDDAIWAKEKFGDAVLEFEFQTTKDANSGVIIECSDKKNWIPNSFEVQIYDSFERANGMDQCGAVYGRCAPMFNVCKAPGEWNKMAIAMMGNRIHVFLNGELITMMNKKEWTDPAKNPDGSDVFNWLVNKAPSETENSGFIGFQGLHADAPVAYRNIKIRKLKRGQAPRR